MLKAVLFDLDGTSGVQMEQAAHVGDRLDLDAEGAAAAGMRGTWLDRLGAASCPTHVTRIASLRELPVALSESEPA